MQLNTHEVLKTLSGEPLKEIDGKDLTVGSALGNGLVQVKSNRPLEVFLLAQKIYQTELVELSNEDIALIKETFPQSGYFPIAVGQILQKFEEPPKEKAA